jgi:hypothetical protein
MEMFGGCSAPALPMQLIRYSFMKINFGCRRAGTCSRHNNQNGGCAAPALRLQIADCLVTPNPRDFEPALLPVFQPVEFLGTLWDSEK